MSNELMRKEMQEAIWAGERSLQSLRAAQGNLNSARNWGIWDLFGGGFIGDMMKHSKMNNAVSQMEQAKRDLRVFQKELGDVNRSLNLQLKVGSFLTFADFFFDGIVADYLVQSKIADARRQVDDAICQVQGIVNHLKRQMNGEV